MDRPWNLICGDLDRAGGRRFPPVVGYGRGYVLGERPTRAEFVRRRLEQEVGRIVSTEPERPA